MDMKDITPEGSVGKVFLMPLSPEQVSFIDAWNDGAFEREYNAVTETRQQQYAKLSDPIFMQYQRGEATEQEWLDAVQAVKDANPYPVK